MSARGRVSRGGVSGRTQRSAPTRWGRRSEPTRIGAEQGPRGAGRSPPPTGVTQVVRSGGPMWSSALTDRRGGLRNHPGQRRTAGRLRQRMRGMGGNRSRDHPQRGQQPWTIPQSPSVRQLPLHKGAFGDGGCGLPRRPVGPPRNDNRFLSFRGAERRGNPSFFTMDDGRGFGPPRSSAPTDGCREPPQPLRQRSERGKSSWSNPVFAR